MKLILLDNYNKELLDKKIYCYEKSDSYLNVLSKKFPEYVPNLVGIIDDNKRNQMEYDWNNKHLPVVSSDHIQNIDWKTSAIIITSDYYTEDFAKIQTIFQKIPQTSDHAHLEKIYYLMNRETEIDLSYRKKYENEPLHNIIVFRSGPHASSYVKGLDFADNARALFEYMLSVGLNRKYELVWIVKNPSEFILPDGKYYRYYRDYENLTFVSFDDSVTDNISKRDEYYRVLCLAKWIFMTDAYGFARNCRDDQIRVQLWHGCGFKTRTNFSPCEKRYEYNIVISELYKKIHADIYGLRDDQVLITGYPKSDWLFHPITVEKAENLGIIFKKVENETTRPKLIFWLPTFRMAKANLSELNEDTLATTTGLPLVENIEELKRLDTYLQERNIRLIIKLHPFQNRAAISAIQESEGLEHIILLDNDQLVDEDVQIGQLLAYADALISDYSSVAVEYLLLDRPIAFTLDDAEEYKNSRGFVFDDIRSWLPGKELYSFDDFLAYVEEISKGIDTSCNKRRAIWKQMHFYNDDKSAKRVVEMLKIK